MYWYNYLFCIIIFIIIDLPYLYVNKDNYYDKIKKISGKKTLTSRYYSVIIIYLALSLGIIFLVLPNIPKNSDITTKIRNSIIYGGIFGIAAYATFDFTMHFMFQDWDIMVSVMDTLWGFVLCSLVTFILAWFMN